MSLEIEIFYFEHERLYLFATKLILIPIKVFSWQL
jgi:hypothetical protein